MGLFSKKIELFAPVSGTLKPISEAGDELFASKAMGDGFVIIPTSNRIYSPVKGKIVSVFPTQHAIAIKNGKLEYLLHLGIDTVELNGEGFDIKVSKNDAVDENTLLGNVDFDFIEKKGKKTDVIFVCTNLKDSQKIALEDKNKIEHSNIIGRIE
ncbi:PTS system glucose-specific EIIA component [Companilactobacillus paralimentarius]